MVNGSFDLQKDNAKNFTYKKCQVLFRIIIIIIAYHPVITLPRIFAPRYVRVTNPHHSVCIISKHVLLLRIISLVITLRVISIKCIKTLPKTLTLNNYRINVHIIYCAY